MGTTTAPRPPWLATAALLLPAYAWLLLAVFLPLLAMLAFSFMNVAPFGGKPVVLTLRHYRAFADQPYLLGVAWATLKMALWTTATCAVLGLLVALAIVRAIAGRLRHAVLLLVVLPFWTNGLVRVFSWTMVLRENGFLDVALRWVVPDAPSVGFLYSRPAIVVGLVHAYLPYTILTCYVALSAIDESLIEAARSLGARAWTVFWEVVLPLARPGIVTGAVLTFVPVVGSFMEPRILGGRVGVTLGTVVEDQFTQAFNWPLGSALAFTILAAVMGVLATLSGVLRRAGRA
jgi:spermidine/putrescine transport system permease protein